MGSRANARRRDYRQVPNPQVRNAAEQFHEAYKLLASQPAFSGVLLAELHCAFIALELYLKALSAVEIEVPDPVLEFGAYVYAESQAKHHRLQHLYDLADSRDQERLDQAVAGKGSLRSSFSDARSALEAHNDLFMASRYPFEPQSSLKQVEMGRLTELLEAVEEVVGRKIQMVFADHPNKRVQPTASGRG